MATKKITPVPKFSATIRVNNKEGDKAPVLKNRHYYQKYLNGAFKDGQEVTITIRRHYKKRSTGQEDEEGNQNGYLYAVVLPMVSEWTGYSIDEACAALEEKLCTQSDGVHGLKKILRFKEMNTVEFSHYVIDAENPDSVRSWVLKESDGTIDIPEPDKEYKNRNYGVETGDNEPSTNTK